MLYLTVGLPRSGKSTQAEYLMHKEGAAIVNPDSIRLSLHGEAFISSAEPYVWAIARTMVESLFLAGHEVVILDACSLTVARRAAWRSKKWNLDFINTHTSKDTCIERALDGGREYLVPVINRMSKTYEPLHENEWRTPYE
jgi:tRNA uridine 5-carbamoylmethylation protein Kti12